MKGKRGDSATGQKTAQLNAPWCVQDESLIIINEKINWSNQSTEKKEKTHSNKYFIFAAAITTNENFNFVAFCVHRGSIALLI